MRSENATVEELGKFWDALQGPMKTALRAAGEIMARRFKSRGQAIERLLDEGLLELLFSAYREVAPEHYRHVDRETVEAKLAQMFEQVRMDLAANAKTTNAVN